MQVARGGVRPKRLRKGLNRQMGYVIGLMFHQMGLPLGVGRAEERFSVLFEIPESTRWKIH